MSSTKPTLADLLARVEAAEAPDRWLFTNIAEVVFIDLAPSPKWWVKQTKLLDVEAWTDAALALCERVLPDWVWAVTKDSAVIEPPNSAGASYIGDGLSGPGVMGGETPALALLAAMLKALISQAPA